MEVQIQVIERKSGIEYFSSSNTKEIIEILLENNSMNNSFVVGYKFQIGNKNFEITEIEIPEIVYPKLNEVNAFVKLYVN
ncbi:MAG: hypothetical protein QM478_04095 [Flavobacteriaceae bacterium]